MIDRRGETQTVDISRTVESAVQSVTDTYPEASVTVDASVNTEVEVHPDFERAVRHAVQNGVEHGDGDTDPVTVAVRRGDDGVEVTVDDRGPGIPSGELEPLRNGTETQLSHGTGVGLWVIDRVVRYSGGTVNFETSDNGTTVRIILLTTDR